MYLKYGQPDLVSLTRIQTAGVNRVVVPELTKDEQKAVAAEARTILNSETFKLVYNNVTARLLFHIQTEAPDLTAIMYDRYSINGAALIREELEELAENEQAPEEEFDQYSII
jgi:2-methylisocitrate lyase-like PEP mutase family enzyme